MLFHRDTLKLKGGNFVEFSFEQIKKAQKRINPYIVKTPMLRLYNLDRFLGCHIFAKAECFQNTGAFKLRGALNRMLQLTEDELKSGIVTASSGNHGRAIAYSAQMLGAKATVVMPHTAPTLKKEAIKALGADVVLCDVTERFKIAEEICESTNAVLIPPYNDEGVMAGQGTAGLEIMEQCPEADIVLVPVSGGGLLSGVATAIKTISPKTKVYGLESSILPRYSASIAAGKPVEVESKKSVADALASNKPGVKCYPYVEKYTDGIITVDEEYILKGMKLMMTEGKLFVEPTSCIGVGALLQGVVPVMPEDNVCLLVSGGNVGFDQLKMLDDVIL